MSFACKSRLILNKIKYNCIQIPNQKYVYYIIKFTHVFC